MKFHAGPPVLHSVGCALLMAAMTRWQLALAQILGICSGVGTAEITKSEYPLSALQDAVARVLNAASIIDRGHTPIVASVVLVVREFEYGNACVTHDGNWRYFVGRCAGDEKLGPIGFTGILGWNAEQLVNTDKDRWHSTPQDQGTRPQMELLPGEKKKEGCR
jgi:hypothetical protein